MIDVCLVGNPNTGKTTLYNTLTGSHEHVGNWHGVTVEEKAVKYSFAGQDIRLVDLPGIYSLTPLSFEEKVSADYLIAHPDNIVVNICDASNLQRNLYLTLCLLERGCKVILVVNQIDKRPICKLDFVKLSEILGVNVVYVNAGDKTSAAKVNEQILQASKSDIKALPPKYISEIDFSSVKDCVRSVQPAEQPFYMIKLFEGDEDACKKLGAPQNATAVEKIAAKRYEFIEQIMSKCASAPERVYGQSKLDKILLNRFLSLPVFLLLLAGCFYLTFFSLGGLLSDLAATLLDKYISAPVINLLSNALGYEHWVVSMFQVAIFGGVGSVLTFLPQVALLFFFLSLLEDSGYLSRVAFVFEDLLCKVGLSGKSVYTLLMGFGCSTTAVLTARNMEDKNSKIKTGLLTPYMSCSAKFPIYAVLGGAFFGASNIFVIIGLYLLGVVVAVLLSYLLEKTVLKSKQQSFILEFPPYRMMSVKRTFSLLWLNVKQFLVRVGGIILAMNVIVWLLSSFSFTFKFVAGGNGVSMLETLGRMLSPIFRPLGFGSWGLVSALIAGLVAKEVIVSSIAMFNGVEESALSSIQSSIMLSTSAVYFASPSSVLSYLVFCLLYFPCIASCAVLFKEIGKKWTLIGIAIEFALAYFVAFVTYTLGRTIEAFGFWQVGLSLAGIAIVAAAIAVVVRKFKNKKCSQGCARCNKSCKKDC